MRLRLVLRPKRKLTRITLNYGYYLSCAIYQWIELSSPDYARFLHDQGFPLEGTLRRFKHFCFSRLIVPKRNIRGGQLEILSPTVEWHIGMPVEESVQHLVIGMFEKREFFIEREDNGFEVEQVETIRDPVWVRGMRFRLLSPLTVSVPEQRNGKSMPHYLRPDDQRLSEALRRNVLNKYASLWGDQPVDTEFRCALDEKFIADRGGPDRISKLITIKQGHADETKVRGFMCPLTIEGNPILIALAYESGLGEKGSLGFGMLEAVTLSSHPDRLEMTRNGDQDP